MKKIAMVVGEDFWLRIPMNNESAGRHLCMDDVEVIHAWLESGYGGCWTLTLETDGEQLEGVAVKVPGSRLGLGTYAVVMAGKFVNGGHFRTKRQLFIRLVDREEQADAKPTMFNEEKAYWAGPAVLSGMLSRDGLNTYELAVLHGYDGTLEQFLAQAGIELQDLMVTKAKLSREVQTLLDKGAEKGITPMGAYSNLVNYSVNNMVYDATTNSSYISLQSENQGHAVTDEAWWKKTFDGNYVLNAIMTAAQQTLNEAKAATEQATAEAIAATEDATSATVEAIAAKNGANAVAAQKVAQAQIGYYECNSLATDATKVTTSGTIGTDTYVITQNGGQMKIRMNKANTVDSNVKLQIGNTTALPLYYNGLPASSDNSWEEGEVLSVYYYDNKYWASNAQGGGGKAKKIKYDNSKSGLRENVQDAIDTIFNESAGLDGEIYGWKKSTYDIAQNLKFDTDGSIISGGSNNARMYYFPVVAGQTVSLNIVFPTTRPLRFGIFESMTVGATNYQDMKPNSSTTYSSLINIGHSGYFAVYVYHGTDTTPSTFDVHISTKGGNSRIDDTENAAIKHHIAFSQEHLYINTSGTSVSRLPSISETTAWKFAFVEFTDGDIATITAEGNSSNAKAYVVLDNNLNILRSASSNSYTNTEIEAQNGDAYIVVNSHAAASLVIKSSNSIRNELDRVQDDADDSVLLTGKKYTYEESLEKCTLVSTRITSALQYVNDSVSVLLPTVGYNYFEILAVPGGNAVVAFLSDYDGSTVELAQGWDDVLKVSAETHYSCAIPTNCKYIHILASFSTVTKRFEWLRMYNVEPQVKHSYVGAKINLGREYTCELVGTAQITFTSGSGSLSHQGGTSYGNYLILGKDTGVIDIHDIVHGYKKLATVTLGSHTTDGTNHNGCLSVAPTVEQGNTFPYLYVSRNGNLFGTCNVENFTLESSEIVQTLTLDEGVWGEDWSRCQWCMDNEGYLWANMYDVNPTTKYRFIKFRKIAVSEGDLTLTAQDVIQDFNGLIPEGDNTSVCQGFLSRNGKIYWCFGTTLVPRFIYVIDCLTKAIVSRIDLNDIVSYEPEDITVVGDDMYMFINGESGIYKLTF